MTENFQSAPMQDHGMANGHCSAGDAVPDFRHPMDIEKVKWLASCYWHVDVVQAPG